MCVWKEIHFYYVLQLFIFRLFTWYLLINRIPPIKSNRFRDQNIQVCHKVEAIVTQCYTVLKLINEIYFYGTILETILSVDSLNNQTAVNLRQKLLFHEQIMFLCIRL